MFEQEMDFFKNNQEKLVCEFSGKVLVIKGTEVLGVFANALDAYLEISKTQVPGSFMIQPCREGQDAYTVTISTLGVVKS